MPRYDYPSKYYADDKDVADILSGPRFTAKRLFSLAVSKGIFLSHELSKEKVIDYLSRIPHSWPQLRDLMEEIETPDPEENTTTCRLRTQCSIEELAAAVTEVQDLRGQINDEKYAVRITERGLQIRVAYSEVNERSTRILQRTHKEMEILMSPVLGGYECRLPNNARAQTIIDKITHFLPVAEGQEKPIKQRIELSGVIDPESRTRFFILLMDGMAGFKRWDVIDLKMNRARGDRDDDEDEGEGDETIKAAGEVLKGLARKGALSGEALLSSLQFRQFQKEGFFVSRAIWKAKETVGVGHVFELEAQFRDADNGAGFCYDLRGVHNYEEGELQVTKKAIGLDDKRKLHEALEASAYAAVEKLKQIVESQSNTTPHVPAEGIDG